MRPHFLYPARPFALGTVDDTFEAEAAALREAGFGVSTVSLEDLVDGRLKLRPTIPTDRSLVYRGWMLNESSYARLERGIRDQGGQMLTETATYLYCHHLPNWYSSLQEFTPETKFFPPDANLELELRELGWDGYFLKDHVKSLKTGIGSIIRDPAQAEFWLQEMQRTRGELEGGICVRRVEALRGETERRYFVIGGRAFAASGQIPALVNEVAGRVPSQFFSLDIVATDHGRERVIEIGDGQVSDLVGWEPERFAQVWLEASDL